jgi:flagellar protein FliS
MLAMHEDARLAYLEAQVLSAPPEKLRLMLIETALCRAREAYEAARNGDSTAMYIAGQKCQQILCELMAGCDPRQSDLAKRVLALYEFLLREVARSMQSPATSSWQTILEILELERETWQMVCQRAASQRPHSGVSVSANPEPLHGDSSRSVSADHWSVAIPPSTHATWEA